jgi:hypothetical protein
MFRFKKKKKTKKAKQIKKGKHLNTKDDEDVRKFE